MTGCGMGFGLDSFRIVIVPDMMVLAITDFRRTCDNI